MKSTIESSTPPTPLLHIPVMARGKLANMRGAVVLFSTLNVGVIIHQPNRDCGANKLGVFYMNWPNVSNSEVWEIMPSGSRVTLEQ